LLGRVDERADAARRDAIHAFAAAYTRRLSDEELTGSSLDELYALVVSTFSFVDARGAQPIAVRAFDPDPASDGYETLGSVLETNTDDSPFLVDSVTEELAARGLQVLRLLHPVIGTLRAHAGRLERLLSGRH